MTNNRLHRIIIWCTVSFALFQSACAFTHCTRRGAVRDSASVVPAEYYASVDGLCGRDLKVALGRITADHEVFAYGALWYYYEYTDVALGTEKQVFDYYSPRVYDFTGLGTAPAGANKEHACPQSWWGSGALCNAYVDLFNVMPSDEKANSAKSHYPVGLVGGSPAYQNARMKVGSSSRAEYKGTVFEPCDEFKGDFARVYLYVATTYADAAWGCKESVASTVAFRQEEYPTVQPWLLSLLLQWNAQDPVSDWEITRNERVFSQQHNRNPFIDYPQLADYIWGEQCDTPFRLADAQLNGDAAGGIGGFFPDEGGSSIEDNQGGNDKPDDQPIGGEDKIGQMLLDEDFSCITAGNDIDNNGSSTQWTGNANFPTVEAAYEAGGAVKLGASKKPGSIQSRPLGNAAGASLVVLLQVKGWSTVEGQLQVTVSGQPSQTVDYTHSMADGYEVVELHFNGCAANSQLTIATTEKRAFISAVRVGTAADGSQALLQLGTDTARPTYCNLMGQTVDQGYRGLALSSDSRIALIR